MHGDIHQAERMTEDDRVQAAADQFLERSLEAQRIAASKTRQEWQPGVCRNCGEQPIVGVYCDDDCKTDHERRARRG